MSVDASGIHELAGVFRSVNVVPEVRQVVSKGSLKIKNQIKKDFASSRHFKGVTDVRYKLTSSGDAIESTIAPFLADEGYGSLTGIAIHGTSRGGGGTVADPLIALRAEEPFVLSAIGDLLEDILE